jgi:hypothetical protein
MKAIDVLYCKGTIRLTMYYNFQIQIIDIFLNILKA